MTRSRCTVEGCDRPLTGRGYCDRHYQRWKKYGDPSVVRVHRSRRAWTERDLLRIEDMLVAGYSDQVIARRMGCSRNALNLARKRHGLRCRTQLLMSARQVAARLGVRCSKTVVRWIEAGWLHGRRGQRRGLNRQWYVREEALWRFMEDPAHWVCWDPARIPDPAFRRWASALRAGVRFLTPGQVAERLCVQHGTVNNWIQAGWLPAIRYGNWWVRESDVAAFTLPHIGGHKGLALRQFTSAEDADILSLRAAGRSWKHIGQALHCRPELARDRWQALTGRQPARLRKPRAVHRLMLAGADWHPVTIDTPPTTWRGVRLLRKAA